MSHILVVEDDENSARLFEVILQRKGGYEVTATDNVANILNLIESNKTDLVIMDVSLTNAKFSGKEIDGVQLTKILKASQRTRNIPVILVTAHTMHGDREELLRQSGADDYLSKPIVDPNLLIEKVRCLISPEKPSSNQPPTTPADSG